MRWLLLTVALLLLSLCTSCSSLKRIGTGLCAAEVEMGTAIDEATSPFGMPGKVFGGTAKAFLKAGCTLFDAIVSAPQDLTDATVGLFNGNATEPEKVPAPQPPQQPQPKEEKGGGDVDPPRG